MNVPQHRSIVVFDITGFGRLDNLAQLRARAALHRVVRSAFRAARVPWRRLAVEDRGDGMIVLVPGSVSKADLLDPLVPHLAAALRTHNAAGPTPIHLRMALHAGEIHRDARGWVGADLNLASRLVNGAPLYRHRDAELVLIVSDVIHHGVVRHGYRRIAPDRYTCVRVVAKEVDTLAWLHLPHLMPNVEVPRPENTASRLGA